MSQAARPPLIWSMRPMKRTWPISCSIIGEERAAAASPRRLCAHARAPITTTLRLAKIVEGCLPRSKPGQSHPATRSFQALRIAVNDEYGELFRGLWRLSGAETRGQAGRCHLSFGRRPHGQTVLHARAAGRQCQPLCARMETRAAAIHDQSRKAIGPDAKTNWTKIRAAVRPSCGSPCARCASGDD